MYIYFLAIPVLREHFPGTTTINVGDVVSIGVGYFDVVNFKDIKRLPGIVMSYEVIKEVIEEIEHTNIEVKVGVHGGVINWPYPVDQVYHEPDLKASWYGLESMDPLKIDTYPKITTAIAAAAFNDYLIELCKTAVSISG